MKELSIFVDESGDFGNYAKHAPYYIVTLVFPEPLIRREKPYQYFLPNERRAIFSRLYYFTLNCNIRYKSFIFHKNQIKDSFDLEAKIARELAFF